MANAVVDQSIALNQSLLRVADLLSYAAKELKTIARTVEKDPSQAWFWTEKWQKFEKDYISLPRAIQNKAVRQL